MSWLTRFEDPIDLPGGRQAFTLKDAADYLADLPSAEIDRTHSQVAMEALMLCSKGGHPELARIAFQKAINADVVVDFDGRQRKHRMQGAK